jgi:ABC-type transporter Mla subunit MlaD
MRGPRGMITRLQLGLVVTIFGVTTFVGLFVHSQSKRLFVPKVEIRADFRETAGLRKGSVVQLAGVDIGSVSRIDFVKKRYECDPLTEDIGRFGQGRTDDCDDFLFCAPVGLCADLEPWADRGEHAQCSSSEECFDDEVCVTTEFRRRAGRVLWSGIHGVCARYSTEHVRVQVKMDIEADKLSVIRSDSRATVASNSVLGDQLVNISTGHGDPMTGELRLQASPSLTEDIARVRARIENLLDAADVSVTAINSVIDELRDERTIGDIKGTIDNLEMITAHIAEQRGLVGALIGSPEYRKDFGTTLRAIRNTTDGLEQTVRHANHILATLDRSLDPLAKDARMAMAALGQSLEDLRDPENLSVLAKLLHDRDGKLTADTAALMHNVSEITGSTRAVARALDEGEGTLGLLLSDPRIADQMGKLLHNLARNKFVRSLALWYMQREGMIDVDGARDPAAPRRR